VAAKLGEAQRGRASHPYSLVPSSVAAAALHSCWPPPTSCDALQALSWRRRPTARLRASWWRPSSGGTRASTVLARRPDASERFLLCAVPASFGRPCVTLEFSPSQQACSHHSPRQASQ
jgi:hypothetical protein